MQTRRAIRYLALLGLIVAGALGLLAGLTYAVDPLQFYRKAAYPPLLFEQRRFQNPGFARSYDYDTVIIGTSLSENFSSEAVHARLGGGPINLSMQGASIREQSLLLEVALRTGKVRRVVWEVNYEYLRGEPDWVSNFDGAFPFYFYDANPWNEIPCYLLSIDTLKSSVRILLAQAGLGGYKALEPDDLNTWRTRQAGKAQLRASRDRALARAPKLAARVAEFAPEKLNANFDAHVMRLVRGHPDVRFDLYFPPYSAALYEFLEAASPRFIEAIVANRAHVFGQLEGAENARLFDFQDFAPIINALDHYYDIVHYDTRVHAYILDAIAGDQHRVQDAGFSELKNVGPGLRIRKEEFDGD